MNKVRVYLLFVVSSVLGFSAPPTTVQIQDTIYKPTGGLATGRIEVAISGTCYLTSGGSVSGIVVSKSLVRGVIDIDLVPNDDCTPAPSWYIATFKLDNQPVYQRVWIVPDSAGPHDLETITQSILPGTSPTASINISQLVGCGSTTGPLYNSGTNSFSCISDLYYNSSARKWGIGTTSPTVYLDVNMGSVIPNDAATPTDKDKGVALCAGGGSTRVAVCLGAYPSATGGSRFGYIYAGDNTGHRYLHLNRNSAGDYGETQAGKFVISNTSPTSNGPSFLTMYQGLAQGTQPFIQVRNTGDTDTRFEVGYIGAVNTSIYTALKAPTGNNAASIVMKSGGGAGSGDHACYDYSSVNTAKWSMCGVWNGDSSVLRFIDPEDAFTTKLSVAKTTGNTYIAGSLRLGSATDLLLSRYSANNLKIDDGSGGYGSLRLNVGIAHGDDAGWQWCAADGCANPNGYFSGNSGSGTPYWKWGLNGVEEMRLTSGYGLHVGNGSNTGVYKFIASKYSAVNDTLQPLIGAFAGADGTHGAMGVAIGAYPSATGANRYGSVWAGDNSTIRQLRLNFNGANYIPSSSGALIINDSTHTADVGVARYAAGALKVTDGSTGLGDFVTKYNLIDRNGVGGVGQRCLGRYDGTTATDCYFDFMNAAGTTRSGVIGFSGGASNNNLVVWNDRNASILFGTNNNAMGGWSYNSATLQVEDTTPTTGSTTLAVKAGAGQSTTPMVRLYTNGGTEVFNIDNAGTVNAGNIFNGTSYGLYAAGAQYKDTYGLTWSSTTSALGTKDTGISRDAAGVISINDGITGTAYRDVKLRGQQYTTGTRPTCDSTNRGYTWYVAGGAGVADTFEVCRKDAGDAYAWVTLF